MTDSRTLLGLTMIEVVIAMAILSFGVLGAFALQTAALQGTRSAISAQDLANAARSELHIQSQFRRTTGSVVTGESCRTGVIASGLSCTVNVFPCSGSASSITCVSTNVTAVAAHQIVVVVTAQDGRTISLRTVVKSS